MWMTLLLRIHEIYFWYFMYCDYPCQQRDKFILEKIFFLNAILHFLRSFFFIVINAGWEVFVKTHVLLYFYNETRSSHQRCSIKAVLENFATFTTKHLCCNLFLNKVAGLQACNFIRKRLQHSRLTVNIPKYLRTPLLKNICERLFLIKRSSLLHHKKSEGSNSLKKKIFEYNKTIIRLIIF